MCVKGLDCLIARYRLPSERQPACSSPTHNTRTLHMPSALDVEVNENACCNDASVGRRTAGLMLVSLLLGAALPFVFYDMRSLSAAQSASKSSFIFQEMPASALAADVVPQMAATTATHTSPLPSTAKAAKHARRPPRVAVVFNAHDNDDVAWLLRYFSDLCLVPYAHDAGPYMPRDAGTNMGYEQSTLLRFIIDHYDALPRHIVALHGDRSSWHSDDMVPMLRRVNFTALPDDAFFNLNYLMDPANWAQGILFQRIGNCSSGCNAPQLWRWITVVWPTLYEPWLGRMAIPHVGGLFTCSFGCCTFASRRADQHCASSYPCIIASVPHGTRASFDQYCAYAYAYAHACACTIHHDDPCPCRDVLLHAVCHWACPHQAPPSRLVREHAPLLTDAARCSSTGPD